MKESVIAWLALAIIVAAGIFVRVHAVGEPMWLDECHTAWAVDTDSPSVAINRAADGNQPPLYFGIVWAVTQLLGINEFSLRVVSLVAGSLLILVAALWGKHLTNRWSAAFLVAGLVAFDGQFIFYASEARSYALVQLIGLLQAICFWQSINSEYKHESLTSKSIGRRMSLPWLLATTLLSIALFFCHYTSVWILIAETFIFGVFAVTQRRFSLKFLLAGFTTLAVALGGWSSISSVFNRRSNWESVSSINTLWRDIEPWFVHWILIPIGFAIVGRMASFILADQGQAPDGRRPHTGASESKAGTFRLELWSWVTLWALLGPLGIGAAAWFGIAPMALVRYSAVCWVAFAIFASLSLTQFTSRTSWAVAAAILASSFFGNWWVSDLVASRSLPQFRSEDWVTTVNQIAASNSTQPIFQFGDVIEDIDAFSISDDRFQQYLLFGLHGADAIRDDEKKLISTQPMIAMPTWNIQFTQKHLDLIREAQGCWLIARGDFNYALIIPDELERYLKEPIEFKFIPNEKMPESKVHLIRIRLVNKP